jgi:hypothetical protein
MNTFPFGAENAMLMGTFSWECPLNKKTEPPKPQLEKDEAGLKNSKQSANPKIKYLPIPTPKAPAPVTVLTR